MKYSKFAKNLLEKVSSLQLEHNYAVLTAKEFYEEYHYTPKNSKSYEALEFNVNNFKLLVHHNAAKTEVAIYDDASEGDISYDVEDFDDIEEAIYFVYGRLHMMKHRPEQLREYLRFAFMKYF